VLSGGGGEEEDVALGEVDERVEDGGFGAVETGGAKGVNYGRPKESAVEVMGLRHGCARVWGLLILIAVSWRALAM
jgi:hypothetical protein